MTKQTKRKNAFSFLAGATANSWFLLLQSLMGNPLDHGCPVTLTIEHESGESPPSFNTPTQHTFLPSERTVVVADVHHDTVLNLFNLREQVDGAAR